MTSAQTVIAVDAMGGDHGPSVVVPGAVDAARRFNVGVTLVGDKGRIAAELARQGLTRDTATGRIPPEMAG